MLPSIKQVSYSVVCFLLALGFKTILNPSNSYAVTGADWRAGNIITDGIFYNNNDMTAGDIQNFLNSKVNCDTWGTKPSEYGGGTRAQYGASRGYPAPYTCLKDYSQNGKSAAQIIKEAADTYRISSKSLIVLLQKEQALVTDEWPWPIQYRSATGYGCPDTAPCDAEYYGFQNQVMKAAYQFRRYATYPSEYRYKPYQNNTIQFNPNTACGSTNVFIENLATAGLYNYTPYQPNASALNNLYGTGDGCGAYGNRNFWRLFNDWFGTTIGESPNYNWGFETLDGTSQSLGGSASALGNYPFAMNINGDLHAFYYDIQNGNLKHSWIQGGSWQFETLDGAGGTDGRIDADVGGMTKAIYINGQIYVFYRDFQNGNLRMANFTGSAWQFETLDGAGGTDGRISANLAFDISIAADSSSVHVFYSDGTNGNLRHGWKTNGGWTFETLDGDTNSVTRRTGNIGQGVSSQFIGNSIHLFYYDGSAGNLVHGWIDPVTGWKFEYLDGGSNAASRFNANIGYSPSFVYVNNSFHVYYYDFDRGALRHAWFDSVRGWQFEHLDGTTGSISRQSALVGIRSTITMENNVMNVFYYNGTNRAIRHAWFDNTGWHFINLDGQSYSVAGSNATNGEMISSTMYGGSVQVFYFDGLNQTLRHAWGGPL